MFLLALLPILLILFLMVGLQWGAPRAGAAGYLTAFLVAVFAFQAGPLVLAYAHARSVLLILDVLLIIWGAFTFYRVVDEAGGIEIIGEVLPHLTAARGMQALLIGWAFASFLQGVGGFGVPVAVTAPLLVGLGFSPLSAVVIPSIGHAWAVTFGSLGSSFNAMMAATGLGWEALASPAAFFLGTACLGAGAAVAHAAGGWSAVKKYLLPVGVMGLLMAGAQYLAAVQGLWNLGGLMGGSAGLLSGIGLAWFLGREERPQLPVSSGRLAAALSGYALLIALTLLVQLTPGLKEKLDVLVLGLDFPATRTGLGHLNPGGSGRKLPLLSHAGTILFLASLLSYGVFSRLGWYKEGTLKRIGARLVRRLSASSVGIAAMVMMAVIMQHAGMTDQLAQGISSAVQGFFPALSPWLGALGAFMTGSNTNSNLIFSVLQMTTAEALGVPTALILAAQTSGGALGSVVAPTKVIVGASTAGMAGQEGKVMRALLPYMTILIFYLSLLTAGMVML